MKDRGCGGGKENLATCGIPANELLDVLEVALYWCLLQLILAQNYVLLTLIDYGAFFFVS